MCTYFSTIKHNYIYKSDKSLFNINKKKFNELMNNEISPNKIKCNFIKSFLKIAMK